MKRRKNLERAIVLSLLLSTSVYGSAFAVEPINETITDGSHNRTYNEDVIVDTGEDSAIEIDNDTVSISTTTENLVENETGKIELNSNKYGIRLDGSGSVSLTAVGDNVIKVTANSTNKEIGDGINVTENAGGTITLNGANNTITVEGEHSDGVYTAAGSNTNINLIATTGNNTIIATNNGIDHRGNNTITLEANDGSNIIKTTNGDGIRVDGTGTVEFNAQNNEITAGDNGIQVEGGGTVNLTATGNNTITANTNGIYASGENSTVNLSGSQGFIKVENSDKDVTGIYVDLNANVDLNTNSSNNKKLEINAISTNANATGVHVGKLTNEKYGTVTNTNAIEDVSINANSNIGEVTGVSVIYSSKFELINLNTFTVNALTNSADAIGISSSYESEANVNAQGNILVNAKGESNEKSGVDSVGIAASTKASITLTSNNGNIIINNIINEDNEKDFNELKKSDIGVQVNDAGKVDLEAKNISISGKQGVLVAASSNKYSAGADVNIKSVNINDITATVDGISVKKTQKTDDIQNIVNLDAKENYINVNAGTSASMLNGVSVNGGIINIGKDENITSNLTDIRLIGNADKKAILYGVRAATVTGIDKEEGQVNIESKSINVTVVDNANGDLVHGVSNNKGIVDFDSDITKIVVVGAKGVGINSQKEGIVTLNADSVNLIYAGELNRGYGKSYAINATGQSDVDLTAGETNLLRGAVYASGHSDTAKTDVTLTGGANMVLSNAYIANAGGLADKNVISALYAEKGANISLDGDYNILGTYAVSSSNDLERVVWAYDTADIDITGLTAISTDSYDLATNSKDIAVVAGTATGLDKLSADAWL